jgi:pimeloyl-ACP methyl ester carboxylesterase
LYSKSFLTTHPEYSKQMQERLSKRSGKEIARVIDAVILDPEDATIMIENLKTPALAIVGQSDYVGLSPKLQTITVPGGHISPHEAPTEIKKAIKKVTYIAGKTF